MKGSYKGTSCLSQQEIIEYLNEKLPDIARYEVESHLLDCPLCNAAVEAYAGNYQHAETELEADLADLVQKKQASVSEVKSTSLPFPSFNQVVALILLLFTVAAALKYYQHFQQNRWFIAFFQPVPDQYLTLRGENTKLPQTLKTAMFFYQEEQLAKSVPHFERYLSQNAGDFEAMYYAGIAELGAKHYSKAIDYLHRVTINLPELYEEANWYLALGYIQTNEMQEAKRILKDLATGPKHEFTEEATALYAKLTQ